MSKLTKFKRRRNCPVKSFGGRKAVPPIGCRKYRQTANQETSLVRECAYLGEDVEGKSNKEKRTSAISEQLCSTSSNCSITQLKPLPTSIQHLAMPLFQKEI
ncbi:hypothetical protein ANCDUO_09503 [Ancylostoma duodenale]|uniref:Uncharacterized protein n=1 Tax=Ancylostoma duodenale TaxID=51022 RepID=A0A0C2DCS8_9BILA|nr:hypothetical protein ANCDUO_09503 [Ancylostoma duodenale]